MNRWMLIMSFSALASVATRPSAAADEAQKDAKKPNVVPTAKVIVNPEKLPGLPPGARLKDDKDRTKRDKPNAEERQKNLRELRSELREERREQQKVHERELHEKAKAKEKEKQKEGREHQRPR